MIWSTGDFIFGGFSDKPWKFSGNKWCKSDKDLLFSLNIISKKVVTTKIQIIQEICSNVTDNCIFYGLTFVYDIYIYSDSNKNRISFTDIGFAYEIPPRQKKTFLAGYEYFKVSEIELFQII